MKYAQYQKIPSELTEEVDGIRKYNSAIVQAMNIQRTSTVYRELKNGIRLMYPKLKFGWDADDFTRNLITVIIEWKVYRVPRIISRMLLRKL